MIFLKFAAKTCKMILAFNYKTIEKSTMANFGNRKKINISPKVNIAQVKSNKAPHNYRLFLDVAFNNGFKSKIISN